MPKEYRSRLAFAPLCASILLGIAGQLMLKWSAVHVVGAPFSVLSAVQLGAALLIYSLGVVNWVLALRRLRLSVAYPVTSVSYVGILCGSYWWFGEQITVWRALGVVLIFFGVMLVVLGMSQAETRSGAQQL